MATRKGMKRALKTKWVAALRSGKFRQTQACLRDGEGFCCLGVLCEISPAVDSRVAGNNNYLSGAALKYVGFNDDIQQKLANFNDDAGYGFRRIATWIEKNL